MEPGYVEWFFSAPPADARTMSMNHYVAVLHTVVESSVSSSWQLTFDSIRKLCLLLESCFILEVVALRPDG